MKKDLLTQTLHFNVNRPTTQQANIFSIVIDGRLTQLHKMLNEYENPKAIINSKDPDGKTPLFYACYFNFQNIVMYLLMRDADPFTVTPSGQNVFHVCAYRGHLECLWIIQHMLRHKLNMQHMESLKMLMKQYRFKKTDVHHGILMCSDKHLKPTQQRFAQFTHELNDQYQHFLDQLLHYLNRGIHIQDQYMKNPIHYASLSKYTKSFHCTRFLTLYSLNLPNWEFFLNLFQEVQLLESGDKKVDPRLYSHYNEMASNFLDVNTRETMQYNFMKHIKRVQKELSNQQDSEGYTPMHVASFAGDFAAVQFLLSIGGDPKIKCQSKGQDVLDYASNDMVRKYLIDLKNAAKAGDEKSFELLVNCGQLVNGKATIYGIAPVHNAIEHTHTSKNNKMLEHVLSFEADVNVADTNGWTPLHHASAYGEIQAMTSLIQRGANVNAFSNRGYFPIHVAAMSNQPKAIRLLHENGSNVNCVDDQMCSSLHHAAKKGYPHVIQTLVELGADIYVEDNRKWTPLHYASFYMHKEVVHLLCRYDADEDKLQQHRNSKGQMAKDLMTNSDVKFAFQTLWKAAREGDLDTVRKLVTLKQDINEQSSVHKFTPLILATQNNHFLIVKYLLSNGADKTIKDQYTMTALEYAQKQENYRIYNLLKD